MDDGWSPCGSSCWATPSLRPLKLSGPFLTMLSGSEGGRSVIGLLAATAGSGRGRPRPSATVAAAPRAAGDRRGGVDWLLVAAILAVAGVYVRALLFTPVEAMQGPAQKIMYVHVPTAWTAFLSFFLVFVFSAHHLWTRSARSDQLALGAADYLVKPVDRDALLVSLVLVAPARAVPDGPLDVYLAPWLYPARPDGSEPESAAPLREILRRSPHESTIYLGDNARAPYGDGGG